MVSFGQRQVGDGHPCFITFEAGPTHDGIESAKSLATLAAGAGADAIKFQILDPDRLVADRSLLFSYDVLIDRETGATETVSEPLYEILRRRALSQGDWREVKQHCAELGLAFFATVGFEDEVNFLESLECDSIKIASADVNHWPLIKLAASTGMCLQLDTGNASIGEIEQAVDIIRAEGNENIIVHQCPSGYPARLESINLQIISSLKQLFPFPIAYSDHTPGWDMDVAAIALGANLVEKTITFDRTTRAVEHIFSLEPHDMRKFVQVVRDVETALGSPRRILALEEIKRREAMRRSVHVRAGLDAGHVLSVTDLDYRRPGDGIPPTQIDALIGRTLAVAKLAGERLSWGDVAS